PRPVSAKPKRGPTPAGSLRSPHGGTRHHETTVPSGRRGRVPRPTPAGSLRSPHGGTRHHETRCAVDAVSSLHRSWTDRWRSGAEGSIDAPVASIGTEAATASRLVGVGRPGREVAVRGSLAATALGALGVVYGDIGTSPLYALSQCVDFVAGKGVPVRTEEIVGVLSLIFWALTLVVSVKYLAVIMRADNQGEGGVLALLALLRVTPSDSMRAAESAPEAADGGAATAGDPAVAAAAERTRRRTRALAALGILGAALLYGDGMITPAISVLSAVEGLAVATDAFEPFVVPITVALLAGLFAVQRLGTAGVARFFGPTMLVWFVAIGGLGLAHVVGQEATHASVLWAVDPRWGVRFLARHGVHGFLVLGAVVLAITGAEALYADLGHFGARPIRAAWSAVVFPALVLNYFGQGALIIERGGLVRHPFFDLAPGWALYPLVVLSAIATIVASQALISGVFSLTQQAAQLGYAPRFAVVHTSSTARGQVYLPQVNAAMTAACIALVLGFRSSDALASAYGIAVTGTMSVTSVLFYAVARRRLGWPRWRAGALVAVFLLVDLSFLLA